VSSAVAKMYFKRFVLFIQTSWSPTTPKILITIYYKYSNTNNLTGQSLNPEDQSLNLEG